MKTHRWGDLKHKMSPARRERLRQEAKAELFEADLRQIREMVGLTQEELAERVNQSQSQVSETERREDLLLSTLQKYVRALGGELEIIASFGDKRVRLRSIA